MAEVVVDPAIGGGSPHYGCIGCDGGAGRPLGVGSQHVVELMNQVGRGLFDGQGLDAPSSAAQ